MVSSMVALARSFLVLFHVSLCLNEVVLGGWPQLGGFGYPYPTNLLIHNGFSDESIYEVGDLLGDHHNARVLRGEVVFVLCNLCKEGGICVGEVHHRRPDL